jgi:hypothetical protein
MAGQKAFNISFGMKLNSTADFSRVYSIRSRVVSIRGYRPIKFTLAISQLRTRVRRTRQLRGWVNIAQTPFGAGRPKRFPCFSHDRLMTLPESGRGRKNDSSRCMKSLRAFKRVQSITTITPKGTPGWQLLKFAGIMDQGKIMSN